VPNRSTLVDRSSEDVLTYCEAKGIGFMPWAPLNAGGLAKEGSSLSKLATKLGVNAGEVALAWMLHRSPVMLPIPGTGTAAHLRENVQAVSLKLSSEDFAALDRQGRDEWKTKQ
jgi:pyridoxine 4-dehydrogenase